MPSEAESHGNNDGDDTDCGRPEAILDRSMETSKTKSWVERRDRENVPHNRPVSGVLKTGKLGLIGLTRIN